MMIRRVGVAALLLLATSLVPSSASAREARTVRPAVWVVGDSVTVFSEDALRSQLETSVEGRVEIDAEMGRNVVELDDLVTQQLARTGRPRTMVLALGTNPDPSWTLKDYRRVVDSIPASITVVLVTVFRSRGTAAEAVVEQMDDYSRWMRTLAASRDNVCLAPWRARVGSHPERYLLDGVHPNERGDRVLAHVVSDAVDRCSD
jgi:hypothetical protein